jgi:phosphoglucosamine mutase
MIFLDHNTTGDGILTALQVMAVMKNQERSLADLSGIMETFPQVLINVRVGRRTDLETVPEVAARMALVREKLGDSGRLLVRFSGTEPLVRVMIEGENDSLIKELAEETADCIAKALE